MRIAAEGGKNAAMPARKNTAETVRALIEETVASLGYKTMLAEGAKHLLGWKTIRYADILTINCEPEELRGRYSSTQCMKLHITTGDDECELSQIVNTNKMLQDRLDGQETDIPVMRLYEFIKEKTGK